MKKATIRLFTTFTLVTLLSLLFSSCTFTRFAEKAYAKVDSCNPYDAIIVPGMPYDKEKTSWMMKKRLFWAKHLYENGYVRHIIFSGGAVYTPFVESIAMKAMADSLGIPSKYTYAETEAEHSTENVYYSWKMAKALGFERIALATDPFQAKMLQGFVKKYTPGVDILPIVFDEVGYWDHQLPVIDTTSAYRKDFVSIKERENFLERFRFTMGKRIKDERKMEARKQRNRDEQARKEQEEVARK